MSQYESGACNIGGRERSRRRLVGYASLGAGAVYLAAVLALGLPTVSVLGVAAFVFGGALGLLQARQQFCVAYGLAGQYGFDDGTGSVEDAGQRARDRRRAMAVSAKAGVVAVVGTALVYGVAVVL